MFKQGRKTSLIGLAALSMALVTPGCTDGELIGAGVIAIGVGAVLVGSGAAGRGDDAPRCRGGYREECTIYHNRWGERRRVCEEVYDSCLYRNTVAAQPKSSTAVSDTVASVAKTQNVSFTAAEKLMSTVTAVQAGDISTLSEVGLTTADFRLISRGFLPEQATIDRVSMALDLSVNETRSLLKRVIAGVDAQRKDSQSAYWQSCLSKSSWRTDGNGYCSQAWWPGCSPETGATLCLSL